MSNDDENRLNVAPLAETSSEPSVTVEELLDALNKAAVGADELNRKLESVFSLPDASAALRLR